VSVPEPERRAFLVSSSTYRSRSITDVDTVAASGRELARLLRESELWASVDHIEDPFDPREVMEPFTRATRAGRAEDTLLFYFTGHADNPRRHDYSPVLLALNGSEPEEDWSYLSLYDVYRTMRRSSAGNKVMILDCCNCGPAGALAGPSTTPSEFAPAGEPEPKLSIPDWFTAEENEHTYVLKAVGRASATPYAMAEGTAGYTAFSGALIGVLREGVAGAPSPLVIEDVFNAMKNRLKSLHAPAPELLPRNPSPVVLMKNHSEQAAPAAPLDPRENTLLAGTGPEALLLAWGKGHGLPGVRAESLEPYLAGFVPRAEADSVRRMVHRAHQDDVRHTFEPLISFVCESPRPGLVAQIVGALDRGDCGTCRRAAAAIHETMSRNLPLDKFDAYTRELSHGRR
jgi:Caspase domain